MYLFVKEDLLAEVDGLVTRVKHIFYISFPPVYGLGRCGTKMASKQNTKRLRPGCQWRVLLGVVIITMNRKAFQSVDARDKDGFVGRRAEGAVGSG